jgi:hypothetical protein
MRNLATQLHEKAWDLEKGADALRDLRDAEMYDGKIAETKAWAKRWFGIK